MSHVVHCRSSQRDTGDSSPTLATPEQADHGLTRTSSSDSFVTADSDSLTEVSADGSTSSAQLSATRACPSKQAPDTRAEKAAVSECRSLCAAKSKKFTVDSARDIDLEIVSARRKQVGYCMCCLGAGVEAFRALSSGSLLKPYSRWQLIEVFEKLLASTGRITWIAPINDIITPSCAGQ